MLISSGANSTRNWPLYDGQLFTTEKCLVPKRFRLWEGFTVYILYIKTAGWCPIYLLIGPDINIINLYWLITISEPVIAMTIRAIEKLLTEWKTRFRQYDIIYGLSLFTMHTYKCVEDNVSNGFRKTFDNFSVRVNDYRNNNNTVH